MNKYQFGTVMPGTKGVGFEYKPLGLEAFAAPLAAKQAAFDKTFEAIDQADLKIDSFGIDEASASKLSAELEEFKAGLLAKLDETGDSKEAARRLRELNKLYNNDPEISGIRQQKAAFKKEDKKQRKRVDGKSFTQKDYEQWKRKAVSDYNAKGGYNYDRATGDYNSIDVSPRGDNLELEYRDMSIKLAEAAATQTESQYISAIQAGIVQAGGTALTDDQLIKLKTKYKNKDQVAGEIFNLLSQGDRYQDWLAEKAEHDFHDNVSANPESIHDGVKGVASMLQSEAENLDKIINSSADEEQIKAAKAAKQVVLERQASYREAANSAAAGGDYYSFAESSYASLMSQDFQQGIADASADIFNYIDSDLSIKNAADASGITKKNKKALEEIDAYKITSVAGTVGKKYTPIYSKGGVGGAIIKDKVNTLSKSYVEEHDRMLEVAGARDGTIPHPEFQAGYKSVIAGEKNSQKLVFDRKAWNVLEEELEKEIADKTALFDDSTTDVNVKAKLRSEITGLREDIVEMGVSKVEEYLSLDNAVLEEMSKEGNEWMLEAYKEGGFDQIYEDAHERDAHNLFVAKNEFAANDPYNTMAIPDLEVESNPVAKLQKEWLDKKTLRTAAPPTYVQYNEASDKFTNGAIGNMIDLMFSQGSGKSTSARRVYLNPGTGEVENTHSLATQDAFRLGDYDENPLYAGVSTQEGDQTLFKYSRKDSRENVVDNIVKGNPTKYPGGVTVDNRKNVTKEEIAQYRVDNPKELILSFNKSSENIVQEAANTFSDLGTAAIKTNDISSLKSLLNGYAAIDVISNDKRRRAYSEKSVKIGGMLKNKDVSEVVSEPPSHWNPTATEGVFEGYRIDYKYVEDEGIVANVSIGRADINGIILDEEGRDFTPVTTHHLSGISPQDIRSLDILYGVGEERDLVRDIDGNIFVPAFKNTDLARKLYNN